MFEGLAPSSMPWPIPAFFCAFLDEHDGDTFKLYVWRWGDDFKIWKRTRLARCNAHELNTPAGQAAKQFVQAWIKSDPLIAFPFIVYTQGNDNYGRPLIEIWRRTDGANLTDVMLATGNAVPYPVVMGLNVNE